MRKSDMVLVGVIGLMFVTTAYFVNEWFIEIETQKADIQKIADNWTNLPNEHTSCEELLSKSLSLYKENFEGREIIQDALSKKSKEMGC